MAPKSVKEENIDSLLELLEDKDLQKRKLAIDSLGDSNHQKALWPVINAIHDENNEVVEHAQTALNKLISFLPKKNNTQAYRISKKENSGLHTILDGFETLLILDYDLAFGQVSESFSDTCEVEFKVNIKRRDQSNFGFDNSSQNIITEENVENITTLRNVVLSKGQKWVIQKTNGLAQTVVIEKIINSKEKEVKEIKAQEDSTIICNVCSITEKGAYTHFLFLFFYVYIFGLQEGAGTEELIHALNTENPLNDNAEIWLKNFFVNVSDEGEAVVNYKNNPLVNQFNNDAVKYFDTSLYVDDFGFTENTDVGRKEWIGHSADVLAYYFCYDKNVLNEIHDSFLKTASKAKKINESQGNLLEFIKEKWELQIPYFLL